VSPSNEQDLQDTGGTGIEDTGGTIIEDTAG